MRSKISLLPEEFKRRNKLKKQMSYIITAVASISVILAVIVTLIVLYRLTLTSSLSALQGQRQMISAQILELQKYEELDKKIISLEGLLAKINTGNADWRGLLIKFSSQIPSGVNISEIAITNGKDASIIKIRGSSVDNYRVGLWLQNLRGISELKDIQCSFSEDKKTIIGFLPSYEISASLASNTSPLGNTTPATKEVKK